MTAKDIAVKCNCSLTWVYKIARSLGRLPTVEEVLSRQGKRGRPRKYN